MAEILFLRKTIVRLDLFRFGLRIEATRVDFSRDMVSSQWKWVMCIISLYYNLNADRQQRTVLFETKRHALLLHAPVVDSSSPGPG